MLHKLTSNSLIALGLTCLAAITVFGQSQANTGSIEGTVSDPSGRSIAGAKVLLVNTGTNFTRELSTDTEGRFRGLLMPLGAYKVTVSAPNFGKLVRDGVNLAVGQSIALPLLLSVASVDQTVTVAEDASVVETSKVERSTLIDSRSIKALPNNGRNFLDFVTFYF